METQCAPEADFRRGVAHERAISPSLDGRVAGKKAKKSGAAQLLLFD